MKPFLEEQKVELQRLAISQKILVQIIWGEKQLEYSTEIVGVDEDGVYVNPYLYNDKPLEINISVQSHVVCNIFTDDVDGKRIGWRNIELETLQQGGRIIYYLTTAQFNRLSGGEERRNNERIVVNKKGSLLDKERGKYKEIRIYDVSDNGISFYIANEIFTDGQIFDLYFGADADGQMFDVKVKCRIVRKIYKIGLSFYGCEIVESNKDYLLYGCTLRMEKKKNKAE